MLKYNMSKNEMLKNRRYIIHVSFTYSFNKYSIYITIQKFMLSDKSDLFF